jgi:hypothetical protein
VVNKEEEEYSSLGCILFFFLGNKKLKFIPLFLFLSKK